jgi:hypothetical protein
MERTIRGVAVMAAMIGFSLALPAQTAPPSGGVGGSFRVDPRPMPRLQIGGPDFASADFASPDFASAGCEVKVLKVAFERPARFMRVDGAMRPKAPSLSVELGNHSARKVKSIDLVVRVLVKDDIYQLDSTPREFPIHLGSIDGVQRLEMGDAVMAVDSVALEQVTYADGTTWRPAHRLACGYRAPGGAMERAK